MVLNTLVPFNAKATVYRVPLFVPYQFLFLRTVLSFARFLFAGTVFLCQAVAELRWDNRPNSKYRYVWEVTLYEGNPPEWLHGQKKVLLELIRKMFPYPELKDVIIK